LEEALADLAQLNVVEPGNADAAREKGEVAKKQREVDLAAKATFAKMFS